MEHKSPVNGATYLIIGILSIIICPVLGPVAVSMSNNALNILDQYENGGEAGQRGLVTAGFACGVVGTVLFGIGLLLLVARGCGSHSSS